MGKASPATRLRGAMTRPRARDGDGGDAAISAGHRQPRSRLPLAGTGLLPE